VAIRVGRASGMERAVASTAAIVRMQRVVAHFDASTASGGESEPSRSAQTYIRSIRSESKRKSECEQRTRRAKAKSQSGRTPFNGWLWENSAQR
jgi:hypothetical protein